jgi:hypothetical protein
MFAGCLAFFVLGIALGTWLAAIFFGAGVVIAAVMLLPGAGYLRLEPDGYRVCSLFRAQFIPWTSVHDFGVTHILLNKVVGMNFEPGRAPARALSRINSGLVGFEGALPETYGMSAEALAELMNDALSKARLRTG